MIAAFRRSRQLDTALEHEPEEGKPLRNLIYADMHGRPTIGLLYGHTAAGAFLATALATRVLVGLPGADPAVMDLPSMAKVTKLPIEVLKEKAKSTPVFAPGLKNLAQTGAIHILWDEAIPLAQQLDALLVDCLQGCIEAGASAFLELGPGSALSAMVAATYRNVATRSLEDFRTLQGARAWLARHAGP